MGMFSELKKIEEQKTEEKKKIASDVPPVQSPPLPKQKKAQKTVSKQQNKKEYNNTSNIVSNITILQLSDDQIDELRDPTNDLQTFRLTAKDKDWIKDTSYLLSKEIRRGSVSQTDILRLSFLLPTLSSLSREKFDKDGRPHRRTTVGF
jgi:hypothetical protein